MPAPKYPFLVSVITHPSLSPFLEEGNIHDEAAVGQSRLAWNKLPQRQHQAGIPGWYHGCLKAVMPFPPSDGIIQSRQNWSRVRVGRLEES